MMQTGSMMSKGTVTDAVALRVYSSNSPQVALRELIPQFERANGCTVSVSYDAAKVALDRIASGETADLFIFNAAGMDELAKQNKIVTGSRRDLARCGVGLAVRAGAPRPDIGSVEAFRRTLLDAATIAYAEAGASGIYFAGVIERLGIAAQVRAKARTRPAGLIGGLVVDGEAELAIQQIPELRQVPGIDIVGPLPRELQVISTITISVVAASKQQKMAQALLEFLTTPAAARVFEANGYERASAPT